MVDLYNLAISNQDLSTRGCKPNEISSRQPQHKRIFEIWESWRYLFQADLERMDHRSRAMLTEMKLEGVKNQYIAEYLPIAFKQLAEEVLRKQNAMDRKQRKRA